jgi:hypothetical protein
MRLRRFEALAVLAAMLAGCTRENLPPAPPEDVIAAVERAQSAVHRPTAARHSEGERSYGR